MTNNVKKDRMMDYCVHLTDLGIVKPGEHWVPNSTYEEAVEDTKAYIKGTGWAGRVGFEYFNSGIWQIAHIGDVSEHAESIGKFKPHAKWDEASVFKDIDLSRSDSKRETFNMTLDEYMRHRNNVVHGSSKMATFAPHKFQQEAIDKAVKFFNDGGNDFLLDAFMRFGKTFTGYKIGNELTAKRILVLTGRPKVKPGWHDDLDHIDFEGWKFIDSQIQDNVKFFEEDTTGLFDFGAQPKTEVIFASFQGAKRKDSRIAQVLEQEIDLVIIDEAHAYYSQDAIDFVFDLKTKKRLWVSGTPFKAYDSGMFNGDLDTYRFTLLDMLREKQRVEEKLANNELCDPNELRYTKFPNIQFIVAEYPTFEKNDLYNEEGLNMKALLSNKDGIANYPDEIHGLLSNLYATDRRSPFTFGGRELRYPVDPNHVWMAVPAGKDDSGSISVAAATTLEAAINNHETYCKKFNATSIRGDKDQDDINRFIEKSKRENKGTCNISCRSLNTGTTFPDMDTVVWLNETSSASEYWQTNGRVFNPKPGKETVNIINYSVEMVVNMAQKMVEYTQKDGQTQNELMTEFLTMMPIYVANGPRVRELDISAVYAELSTKGSARKGFKSNEVLDKNFDAHVLNNMEFWENFPDVDDEFATEPTMVELFKTDDKGKNALRVREKDLTKPEKNVILEARRKVKAFLTLTGSVMAASLLYDEHLITSAQDLKDANADTINSELLPGTKELIVSLMEGGVLNVPKLDQKISSFYHIELKDKVHV